MSQLAYIIALTFGAGLCMPIGALLARVEHIGPNWLEQEFRHFMVAFGGGLLLGAVFDVLLPEGLARLDHSVAGILIFLAGGLLFFLVERRMGLAQREAPQMLGMLLDYIPESLALGGLAAGNPRLALLLAVVIGLQNVPEGFNSYRELEAEQPSSGGKVLRMMFLLTLIGPLMGLGAYYFLDAHPAVLGGIMLAAAGGLMYLIFQDIAPASRLERHWAPPLGAVAGFGVTLLSDLLLGQL
jgi:ZIP family zinc transporter